MGRYILRRLIVSIPVLFLVTIIVFGGIRVVPGDICAIILQTEQPAEEQCRLLKAHLGLDKPAVSQYFSWLGGILTGDFGKSMLSGRPVIGEIQQRTYTTLQLGVLSVLFAIALALPIGVFSALKQDKWQDVSLRGLTIGWLSMPSFWVGTLLIVFLAKWFGYSPPIGYVHFWKDPLTNLEQMYLPAFALGLALSATLARLTRSSMLEVLRQDYIRTARAKGLQERIVLYRHALKNAMLPVITLLGIQISFLLSGTVVLESLFALPGLGTLLLHSVIFKDFTMVQGLVLFFAVIVLIVNLAVDVSYAWFDPRVRYN